MHTMTGFFAIVLVMIVFMVATRRTGVTRGAFDFLVAQQRYSPEEFASSQISYSLQMATVYPYFFFAFSGLWWLVAWNTLFFAAAIILLHSVLPRFTSKKTSLLGSTSSIHEFIARLHNAPAVRGPLAWISIIAFTGLATFEIVGEPLLSRFFSPETTLCTTSVS